MNSTHLEQEIMDDMDAGISVEIEGASGVGKSEVVANLVNKCSQRDGFEWGFATLFLATQTPSDMLGYLFKGDKDFGDGEVVSVTDPTLPLWMVTQQGKGKPTWHYKRGILLLDEYGQGEADTKRASAELLLNKKLGPWTLGGANSDGWGVIACSNRTKDRSGVTKSFDFIINRRKQYTMDPHAESWERWAVTNGVTPLTISFAMQYPQIVFHGEPPEKQGPWCTPRSLVMMDKVMKVKQARTGSFPDDPYTVEGAMGLIGPAVQQYFSHVRLEREMPKFETIVANPKSVKVAEKPDAQMLVVYNLAHRVTAATMEPVIEYIERMPKEFAATFAKAACKRDPNLVINPAMRKWSSTNASLMAALTT